MSSPGLLPGTPEDDNALRSMLSRVTSHEGAGAAIPFDLLRFGLVGSIVVVATGLLALILPGADSVRHSDFYLVLGGLAADITLLVKALAIPAIIAGVSLLVLDIYLMQARTSARSRPIIVAQAAMGGTGGVICTALLALLVLNLVIWITLIMLCLVLVGIIVAGIASGG